jgi:hypothetical protein
MQQTVEKIRGGGGQVELPAGGSSSAGSITPPAKRRRTGDAPANGYRFRQSEGRDATMTKSATLAIDLPI